MTKEILLNQLKSETKLEIFSALGCPSRDFKGLTVNEIAQSTKLTPNNISKQLMDLRKYNFVKKEAMGRKRIYSLNLNLPTSVNNVIKAVINMQSEEKIKKGNHEFHKFDDQK